MMVNLCHLQHPMFYCVYVLAFYQNLQSLTKKSDLSSKLTAVNTALSSYFTGISLMAGHRANRPFYSCVLSYLAMNASEAGVDLALIQTSLLFSCKCQLVSICIRTT